MARFFFLLTLFCFLAVPARAANSPWVCPTNLTGIGTSGSLASTTVFTAPTSGWYDLKLALLPAASTIAATALPAFTYTSSGQTGTVTGNSISLINVAIFAPPVYLPIYVDSGTAVTLAITAPTGTYNWRVCWKPGS